MTIMAESMTQEKNAFIKSFNHFGDFPPMMWRQPVGVWSMTSHVSRPPSLPGSGNSSITHGATKFRPMTGATNTPSMPCAWPRIPST
jgi:hypothetical protein